MNSANIDIQTAVNERVRDYIPGSSERASLLAKLSQMENEYYEIPLIIGGREVHTGNTGECKKPHDHQHVLATYHKAGEKEVQSAIDAALDAWSTWSALPLSERTAIFRRAAELLAGPWRDTLNAATMLNQSKTVYQAEIDSACELIDFFNFNCQFAEEICSNQPLISPEGMHNHLEYRPLKASSLQLLPLILQPLQVTSHLHQPFWEMWLFGNQLPLQFIQDIF